MNKFDRVISTHILLQSKKVITASNLAERFGISLRTVYRDINTLKNAGIPIIGDPGIGYSLMEGYRLPPIMFDEGEALALLTAEKLIGNITDQSMQANYSTAMTKIKAILRSDEKYTLEILDDSIAFSSRKTQVNKDYLQTIFKSIANRTTLKIAYQKIDKSNSERCIEPIGCYYLNNWYLVAYCQLKQDYRTFKVNRIQQSELLDEQFTPNHISLQHYMEQQKVQWTEQQNFHTIEVAFDKSVAKYAEYKKLYFGFVKEEILEHEVRMTFWSSSLEIMGRWLLEFTDQVRVIQPQALREQMKEFTLELYQHYCS